MNLLWEEYVLHKTAIQICVESVSTMGEEGKGTGAIIQNHF